MPKTQIDISQEDASHRIEPATNGSIENALRRSGLTIRKEPKHVTANPYCVDCNAPPSCRGVALGKNCPADPTH